jgi:hypothetical protein
MDATSCLQRTTAFQSLTRLELCQVALAGGVDLGCLAGLASLQALAFDTCSFAGPPNSLSRLTQLESLCFIGSSSSSADQSFQLPTSGLAALSGLTSLDIGTNPVMAEHLGQAQLQLLQRVLGGLHRLGLGRFTGVQDAALLAGIGCTALHFGGFEGCAEPPGSAPLLPGVVSLQLPWRGALCPLVLRQSGLTSLSLLAGCSDAECEVLVGAFPQLRVLQLLWPGEEQPGATAAGLAHLAGLPHLQQLALACPGCPKAAELEPLAGLRSLGRLVMSLSKAGLSDAHQVELMMAGLAARSRGVREVVLAVPWWTGAVAREALQRACDKVVARSGRQDLAMEARRMWDDEAWQWMLAHPVE